MCLVFACGVTIFILRNHPIVYYDELNYAETSQHLYYRWMDVLHPGQESPAFLDALDQATSITLSTQRPPFYLPAVLIAAILHLDWSVDLMLLLDLWVYLPMLFLATAGSVARLGGKSHWGILASASCLTLASILWESSSVLMGDLPVTAVVALLVYAWVKLIQQDRWRDYLLLGVTLAWGILTKPTFLIFALAPVLHLGYWFTKRHLFPGEGTRSRWASLGHAIPTIGIPLLILIPIWDSLSALMAEVYAVNETLKVYIVSENLFEDLAWPITLATEMFPLWALWPLAGLWIAALFHPKGRWAWLPTLLLLGYVSLRLNQRSARVFETFLLAFAILTGLGVAALPRRWARAASGTLFLLSALMCFGTITSSDSLNRTILRRVIHWGALTEDGAPYFQRNPVPMPMESVGDEYGAYQMERVMELTHMREDPDMETFVAFGGQPLNWTSYESLLTFGSDNWPSPRRFFSTGFRFGGAADPGGMNPKFFEAGYVLAKTGFASDGGPAVDLYFRFLNAALTMNASPFQAGLERIAVLDLPKSDRLFVYRRVREPSDSEWLEIVAALFVLDADNPWNVRYALKTLDFGEKTKQLPLAQAAATWILSLAKDPVTGPKLADRFDFIGLFPQLQEEYDIAWKRARAYLPG